MKLFEAERFVKDRLKEIYGEQEAANMAALLMEHVTGLSKTERVSKKQEELSSSQSNQLRQNLQRLQLHEPVQYVMNKAWFYGMELYVDKNVLIPRPETEELVKWIIDDVKASGKEVFVRGAMEADETTQLKILDVGTGSGCIALALKKKMPKAEVWGCDISEEALNVARRNGSFLNIRVDFQGVNFLEEEQQKSLPTVDIIVSNPPYIPLNEKGQMHANVVDYEPHAALFLPDNDPLIFYKALADFGKKRLYANGSIYMEIHEEIGNEVLRLFKKNGYDRVESRKDMQGKERMVKALPGGKK
jgi:release factor glutamine methyltransferase